ncbi:hypothetical protein [uncultured Tenacibaculum sp.]|uniref:hypothetical protein n=1 Tax=uncultured Tenacibaculum sp. TaxID=174713 RepID=UPI002627DF34|nr:hypothetical protein [uncultured Tenacibaculum sp.]
MLAFLKYYFQKLKESNAEIKDITKIINKTWVQFDNARIHKKWFFKRANQLSVSVNGTISDGTYEFVNGYLIVRIGSEKLLFNNSYFEKDVLVLERDSTNTETFVFFNENKLNKEDFITLIANHRKKALNIKELKLMDNTIVEIIDGNSKFNIEGKKVLINNKQTELKELETEKQLIVLNDSVITNRYFKGKYVLDKNNKVTILQKYKNISSGDFVSNHDNKLKNDFYKVGAIKGVKIENNKVVKVYSISKQKTIFGKQVEYWHKFKNSHSSGDVFFLLGGIANNGYYILDNFKIVKVKNGRIC